MHNFEGSVTYESAMDKKDIIIIVSVLLFAGLSLYRKFAKKKGALPGSSVNKPEGRKGLRDQPDDYEPYSGKKDQE